MTTPTNTPTQQAMTEEEALRLVAFLTASADTTLREPKLYGPFRLIDAARQVAEAVLKNNPAHERRAFWEAFKAEIDEKDSWLMIDRVGFREFVQQIPATAAKELKGRVEERKAGAES